MPVVSADYAFTLLPFGNDGHANAMLAQMWANVFEVSRALGLGVTSDDEFVHVWHSGMVPETLCLVFPYGHENLHVNLVDPLKCFDGLRLAYETLLDISVNDGSCAHLPDFALRDAILQLGRADKVEPARTYLGDAVDPAAVSFVIWE